MSEPQGTIDFFISYRGPQAVWARWVNWVVRSAGFSTVLMDEFQTGTDWTSNMRNAARDCRRLIPLYSVDYWASGACIAEFDAYWHHHMQDDAARFLLPLVIQDCTVPDIQAPLLAARLFTLARDDAYAAIHKVLEGITPSATAATAFAESEPPFPSVLSAGGSPAPSVTVTWPAPRSGFAPDMADRDAEFTFFAGTLTATAAQHGTLISAGTDHGKTRLVAEFHRYGCEVLGAEACCLVDFKARGTVDNLLDTIAGDLGTRIPGLAARSPARLREGLRKAARPVLFVFDTFERATEEARDFVESHFLAEMGKAAAMRILLAGQPQQMPDPAKAAWRAHARRFNLGSIEDPALWVKWAARAFPHIPAAVVAAIAVSAGGAPGAIANQLATLGTFDAVQLAALGIR